ncbi:MAG: hypothetical protein SF162_08955 [bacterium]|nr:hypothetical protein [bacterium]
MLNVTRGGLAPGKIVNLSTKEEVRFMFNPFEYSLSKSNDWTKKPVMGQNLPQVVFEQGGAQQLSLTLHFDSYAEAKDVRTYTNALWKMMMIDESKVNAKSGKAAPPPVEFQWGKLFFKSIIVSLSQKFTLFDPSGVPLRCTVDITLQQYLELPPPITSGGSGGAAANGKKNAVEPGDRIDHVAQKQNGDPNSQREIAERNNIDNPMKVKPGTPLK